MGRWRSSVPRRSPRSRSSKRRSRSRSHGPRAPGKSRARPLSGLAPAFRYETPGPEETIRVEKKAFDISRAELADSAALLKILKVLQKKGHASAASILLKELSLQTIGSIARRVSASLGGESRPSAVKFEGADM